MFRFCYHDNRVIIVAVTSNTQQPFRQYSILASTATAVVQTRNSRISEFMIYNLEHFHT